jgi:hypothetical protein
MRKPRHGHAANAKLNGEWGSHVKKWMKKITSGRRRAQDKRVIREEIRALQLTL